MKTKLFLVILTLFGALFFAFPCFATDYYVYCANGKITIDTRNHPQLTGGGVYQSSNLKELARFSDPGMAKSYAQNQGGVGAACGSAKAKPKTAKAKPAPAKPKAAAPAKPRPVEETWTPQTMPQGFMAMSPEKMPWEEAKAYCASQGGKLPRVEGRDILGSGELSKEANIEGFGKRSAKLPEGLPRAKYWTGTPLGAPNKSTGELVVWIIEGVGGATNIGFSIGNSDQFKLRAICVP